MSLLTVASLLVGLALLVIVIMVVARPLLRPAPAEARPLTPREQLLDQKAAILDQIRALDFDYETNKIPQEVYELQRAFLMEQAADTLKKLDELPEATAGADVIAQINEAIVALRSRPVPSPGVVPAGSNGRGGYCTHCGHELDQGHRFCARCAHPVPLPKPPT